MNEAYLSWELSINTAEYTIIEWKYYRPNWDYVNWKYVKYSTFKYPAFVPN